MVGGTADATLSLEPVGSIAVGFLGIPAVLFGTDAFGQFLAPVFAGVYKVLPDVKLQWHEVWVGGFFTSALFTLGQLGIGLYLGQAAPGSAFGAAATLTLATSPTPTIPTGSRRWRWFASFSSGSSLASDGWVRARATGPWATG